MAERARHYACLTADLVSSRDQATRGRTQARLERLLDDLNAALAAVVVPFSITLGDEFQGLLGSAADAAAADLALRQGLHPVRLRTGIGIGKLSTPRRERTALMDGACFHRSRTALEVAKKQRGSAMVLRGLAPAIDDVSNGFARVLMAVYDGWTDKQHRSVVAYQRRGTEAAAAEDLRVKQPTLHKSLSGAMGKPFLEAHTALVKLLREFPAVAPDESSRGGSR